VQFGHSRQLFAQGRGDAGWQHRHPVLEALVVPHQDLAALEIDILHPQAQAFHDAQAGAVQHPADQCAGAVEPRQERSHLGAGQHHRQAARRLCRLDVVEPGQFDIQHLAVKEEQGALGLVLRRCRNLPGHRQMGEELADLGRAHVTRVTLAKMPDKSFNPIQIGLLGTQAVMQEPYAAANLLQQAGCRPRIRR
jgi:hypothetical protein